MPISKHRKLVIAFHFDALSRTVVLAISVLAGITKRLNFDDIIYMSYSIDFRRKVIFTMEEEGL
ncbi:hypothetical protein, partial [Arsenophonus endosymbiont of Bemisia tabaci]|uniref:hypothetical protein n=1 Tax=Arsenophonus endosymbiont of Bemisia tabaci TaxID=536059 RepID=UPI0015F4CC68